MAKPSPMGASAQILTHARFDRSPVVQTPRRGRLPNSVIKFWQAGGDIRMARYKVQKRLEEIEITQARIADHQEIADFYRIQLANLNLAKGSAKGGAS